MTLFSSHGNRTLGAEVIRWDDGRIYLIRVLLPRNYRVNFFFTEDPDEDPHDHPWDFETWPLMSYVEEVWEPTATSGQYYEDGKFFTRREPRRNSVKGRQWHSRSHDYIHRVMHREKRGFFLGCLFITLMKTHGVAHEWGFWPRIRGVRGVAFVPWRRYKHSDCGSLNNEAGE